MSQTLNPYLNFRGDARAALEFYRGVFGGDLNTMTFEQGGMVQDGVDPEQLMHGQLETPSGFTIMGSDIPGTMGYQTGENQFSVSLSGDDADGLHGYWERLSDGATVQQPLSKAPWGDEFGMLVDRFEVPWLINISGSGS